jgi:hypothetical protein
MGDRIAERVNICAAPSAFNKVQFQRANSYKP